MSALARAGAAAQLGSRRSRTAAGPINTIAPVLGEAYAGASPTITAGTWTGAPTLTYSLEVDGVEVVAGDEATVEAYVYVLGDEGYDAILYEIPDGDTGAQVASNTVVVDLAAKIVAVATAASIVVGGLFLARRKALDVSVVSTTHVETWLGEGADGSQATDTARPTWSDTAVNSRPGMTLDGGDALVTGAIDVSPYTAFALGGLFSDTDTAAKFVLGFGALADRCLLLNTNAGSAGTLDIYVDGTAGAGTTISRARSTTSYAMTSPAVVTGTWDRALASAETEIRHAGANVTDSRPNDSNSTTGFDGSEVLTIGAREASPTGNITGAMAAAYLLAHTGSWSGAQLTALATIEALIATAWGL